MFEKRTTFRSLMATAIVACLSFATTSSHMIDHALAAAYNGIAYAFNTIASFGGRFLASLMNIAPARADELRPLERAKLTASESHSLAAAKRERPVIFASWRMSPSC